jgi:dTDP-4-dehydrorhamnose 3,5-epimerase
VSAPGLRNARRPPLPHGVEVRPLVLHRDGRGGVAEVFRNEWDSGVHPVQWTVISSNAGVLRGVHVHPRHDDYVTVIHGWASLGLRDLRRGSPTEESACLLDLHDEAPLALVVPHGVAHGLYFHEPTTFLLGVSAYFDSADELGCYWADPALGIDWPVISPVVSDRDARLPPLAAIRERIGPWSQLDPTRTSRT